MAAETTSNAPISDSEYLQQRQAQLVADLATVFNEVNTLALERVQGVMAAYLVGIEKRVAELKHTVEHHTAALARLQQLRAADQLRIDTLQASVEALMRANDTIKLQELIRQILQEQVARNAKQ